MRRFISAASGAERWVMTVDGRSLPARLRWRCRRGMRELDVLLERYLQERYPLAGAEERQAFEALLDLPDPQLFAYLMRREIPPHPEWIDVIAKLAHLDP